MDSLIRAHVAASQNRHKTLKPYRHDPVLPVGAWATPAPEQDCVFAGYDAEGLAIYRFTERFW